MPSVARARAHARDEADHRLPVEGAGAQLDAADRALLQVEPLGERAHLQRHGTDEGEGPHGVRS